MGLLNAVKTLTNTAGSGPPSLTNAEGPGMLSLTNIETQQLHQPTTPLEIRRQPTTPLQQQQEPTTPEGLRRPQHEAYSVQKFESKTHPGKFYCRDVHSGRTWWACEQLSRSEGRTYVFDFAKG